MGRITDITDRINLARNPNIEIGKPEQIKETKSLLADFQQFDGDLDKVYEYMPEKIRRIKQEKREMVDRQEKDAREDGAILGIGIEY